jgi:hypothetical protein
MQIPEPCRLYVVYDIRALVDMGKASVLEAGRERVSARYVRSMWGSGVVFSYDINEYNEAIDERFEFAVTKE